MPLFSRGSPALIQKIDQPRIQIFLYGIIIFLFWMSLNLYAPTLPNYLKTRTNDLALIGSILGMYGLFGTVIRLPLGIAADWLGRGKSLLFIGIVLEGLGAWLMGSADNVNTLLLGRAICGIAAATWVVIVVAFSNLFPQEEAVRATVILTMIPSFGRLLGSLVTGWLNEMGGYPLAFFISTGIAGLALLFLMPATDIKHSPQVPSIYNFGKLVTRRDVLVPSLLNTIGQYAFMGAVFGFIPLLAQRLGAGNVMLSLNVSVFVILYALGNLAATSVNRLIGSRTLVMMGILFIAVGYGIAAIAPSLEWIFIAQACFGLGEGISYPVIMGLCIEKVPINERSTAMGLHQTIYSLGGFIGPWLSGIIAKAIGIQPMFGVTAPACLALGLLGVYFLFAKSMGSLVYPPTTYSDDSSN
jgi:DHA1 family multidrug resistance protein-like MFS transporter